MCIPSHEELHLQASLCRKIITEVQQTSLQYAIVRDQEWRGAQNNQQKENGTINHSTGFKNCVLQEYFEIWKMMMI